MPLVDLKTDLKSLKFGGDRQGGGWSGQPFISSPIEDSTTSINQKKKYDLIRNSLDFPLRGGAIDYDARTTTFTVFNTIDKERIKKFMNSKPRGSAFLQKQIGLQLSNPNTQTGNGFFNFTDLSLPIPAVLQNTKIYNNGFNTLAQVGLAGSGFHAVRHGTVPINTNAKYYSQVVGAESLLEGQQLYGVNRLLIMSSLKLSRGDAFSTINSLNINQINRLGISRNKNVLFDYLTGPGSVYGVGKTTIKRYDDTRTVSTITQTYYNNIPGNEKLNLGPAMTYDMIASQNLNNTTNGVRTKNIQDYKTVNQSGGAAQIATREQLYNYTLGVDNINKLSPKLLKNSDPWPNDSLKDMIKFGFECLSNNNPSDSVFLQFRAYLTSGINDSNQASWNNIKYIGRGEDFFTYQGISRTISVSFRVVAQSREELLPMYNKLNYLVSQVYPDYSPNKGIMRGSVIKLTIGDYLYRMPGILENVNLTIDKDSSWEINNGSQLPHYIDVSISFKPILQELPRRANIDNIPAIIANGNNIIDKSLQIENIEENNYVDKGILSDQTNNEDIAFNQRLQNNLNQDAIKNFKIDISDVIRENDANQDAISNFRIPQLKI